MKKDSLKVKSEVPASRKTVSKNPGNQVTKEKP